MEYAVGNILPFIKDYIIVAIIAGILSGYIVKAISGNRFIGSIAGILVCIGIVLMACVVPHECIACGETITVGQKYCQNCGVEITSNTLTGKIKCSSCDRCIDAESNVCGYCGTQLK